MNHFSPARLPNEPFEDYKLRRKAFNDAVKEHKKGTLLFDSARVVFDKEGQPVLDENNRPILKGYTAKAIKEKRCPTEYICQ